MCRGSKIRLTKCTCVESFVKFSPRAMPLDRHDFSPALLVLGFTLHVGGIP